MKPSEPVPTRALRMSRGGRLAFRGLKEKGPAADRARLPLVDGSDDPRSLQSLIPPGETRPVEVEVGSGKGGFLLAASEARPDRFLIGVEASPSHAEHAARLLADAGRDNALVLIDNAVLFLDELVPAGALARVHVYFPDPWPKRRHRRRRFFGPDCGARLHRVLAPDGHLLVATDNAAYAGAILRCLGASPLLRRDPEEERRILAAPPGNGFGPTHFERKYQAEGRVIRRSAWRRVEAS